MILLAHPARSQMRCTGSSRSLEGKNEEGANLCGAVAASFVVDSRVAVLKAHHSLLAGLRPPTSIQTSSRYRWQKAPISARSERDPFDIFEVLAFHVSPHPSAGQATLNTQGASDGVILPTISRWHGPLGGAVRGLARPGAAPKDERTYGGPAPPLGMYCRRASAFSGSASVSTWEHQVQHRLVLDFVVRKGETILEMLAPKN